MNVADFKKLLGKNRIKEVLDLLLQQTKGHVFPYNQEVILIQGRFNALQQERIVGAITEADDRKELNVIRRDISNLLHQVDQWWQAGPKLCDAKELMKQEIEHLAKNFEEADKIKSIPSRLRTKNDLIRKIGEKFLHPPLVVTDYLNNKQEGIAAAIAWKIQRFPNVEDLDYLEILLTKERRTFTKGAIVNALGEIIYSGQMRFGDDQRIYQLLSSMQNTVDIPLKKNIERVQAALDHLVGILPRASTIKLYDPRVESERQNLEQLLENGELTTKTFILTLSNLFDRGTFRFEPCIRECKTQLWKKRWIAAFDTYRMIEIFVKEIRADLSAPQRKILSQLRQQIYKYADKMGALLFEGRFDQSQLTAYMEEDSFPLEKVFGSSKSEAQKPWTADILTEINQPQHEAIALMDQLQLTIEPDYLPIGATSCPHCICKDDDGQQ